VLSGFHEKSTRLFQPAKGKLLGFEAAFKANSLPMELPLQHSLSIGKVLNLSEGSKLGRNNWGEEYK